MKDDIEKKKNEHRSFKKTKRNGQRRNVFFCFFVLIVACYLLGYSVLGYYLYVHSFEWIVYFFDSANRDFFNF